MYSGEISKNQIDSLRATLIPNKTLTASLNSTTRIYGAVHLLDGYDSYNGSYEVTPKLTEQIIDVSDKKMDEDMIIKPIPFYEVSNEKGMTVIIGG